MQLVKSLFYRKMFKISKYTKKRNMSSRVWFGNVQAPCPHSNMYKKKISFLFLLSLLSSMTVTWLAFLRIFLSLILLPKPKDWDTVASSLVTVGSIFRSWETIAVSLQGWETVGLSFMSWVIVEVFCQAWITECTFWSRGTSKNDILLVFGILPSSEPVKLKWD